MFNAATGSNKSVAMDFGAMFASSSSSATSSSVSTFGTRANNKRRMPSFSRRQQDVDPDDSFVASPEHFRLRLCGTNNNNSIELEARRLFSPPAKASTSWASSSSKPTVDESNSLAAVGRSKQGDDSNTSSSSTSCSSSSSSSATASPAVPHWTTTGPINQQPTVPWQLPRDRSLAHNEAYLNEQLDLIGSFSYLTSSDATNQRRPEFLQLDALLQQLHQSPSDNQHQGHDHDHDHDHDHQAPTEHAQQQQHEQILRQVMDIINGLLFLRQQELNRQTLLSQSLSQTEHDVHRKQHLIDQLTDQLAHCERELGDLSNVLKAKETKFQQDRNVLLSEKKQLEKQNLKLLHVDSGYKAAVRKKEQELAKLQQLLQRRLERSTGNVNVHANGRGIVVKSSSSSCNNAKETVLNDHLAKQRLAQQPNRLADGPRDQELQMTQRMVQNYERRQADLLFENETLTKSLERLQEEFHKLVLQYQQSTRLFVSLRQQQQQQGEEDCQESPQEQEQEQQEDMLMLSSVDMLMESVPATLPNGVFYDQMQVKLHQLRDKIKLLCTNLEQAMEHRKRNPLPTSQQSSNACLTIARRQLQDALAVVREQDEMLKSLLFVRPAQPLESSTSMDLSWLELEREQLDTERKRFETSQANFQRDRALFDQQAQRLDQERFEFEHERHHRLQVDNHQALESHESQFVTPVKRRPLRSQQEASPFALPVEATPETKVLLDDIIGVSRLRLEESIDVQGHDSVELLSPILAVPSKQQQMQRN